MRTIKRLISVAALAGFLGCAGTGYYDSTGDYYASTPPPAEIYEPPGYAPYPGAVWINGYWGWGGSRYYWTRGHWDRPRPGYVWVPHRWYRDGGGWRFHAGYWR